MIEPVQGEGGVRTANLDFLNSIMIFVMKIIFCYF